MVDREFMHYIAGSESIAKKKSALCGIKFGDYLYATNVRDMITCEKCLNLLAKDQNLVPGMEIKLEEVPKDMEECLSLIGDYGLDVWLGQIIEGKALHSNISTVHAMIMQRLIELAEESLVEEEPPS